MRGKESYYRELPSCRRPRTTGIFAWKNGSGLIDHDGSSLDSLRSEKHDGGSICVFGTQIQGCTSIRRVPQRRQRSFRPEITSSSNYLAYYWPSLQLRPFQHSRLEKAFVLCSKTCEVCVVFCCCPTRHVNWLFKSMNHLCVHIKVPHLASNCFLPGEVLLLGICHLLTSFYLVTQWLTRLPY